MKGGLLELHSAHHEDKGTGPFYLDTMSLLDNDSPPREEQGSTRPQLLPRGYLSRADAPPHQINGETVDISIACHSTGGRTPIRPAGCESRRVNQGEHNRIRAGKCLLFGEASLPPTGPRHACFLVHGIAQTLSHPFIYKSTAFITNINSLNKERGIRVLPVSLRI